MSKTRRQFSVEQKLAILNEADQNGVTQTLRKLGFITQRFSQVEEPV